MVVMNGGHTMASTGDAQRMMLSSCRLQIRMPATTQNTTPKRYPTRSWVSWRKYSAVALMRPMAVVKHASSTTKPRMTTPVRPIRCSVIATISAAWSRPGPKVWPVVAPR